jgi:hypothetical protein
MLTSNPIFDIDRGNSAIEAKMNRCLLLGRYIQRYLTRQALKVSSHDGGIGMLGAERLLADRQRALVERPRRRKIVLRLKQAGEVVEALPSIGMVGAERLLADRQRWGRTGRRPLVFRTCTMRLAGSPLTFAACTLFITR